MSQPPERLQLTRFLTALSHWPELLDKFYDSPRRAAAGWHLSDEQIEMLERGNLAEIQQAVSAEVEAEGGHAVVGWWIRVAGETEQQDSGGVPDWWIRS